MSYIPLPYDKLSRLSKNGVGIGIWGFCPDLSGCLQPEYTSSTCHWTLSEKHPSCLHLNLNLSNVSCEKQVEQERLNPIACRVAVVHWNSNGHIIMTLSL